MKNPDELIMYIIINQDLNMSIGKTAVQVGHAISKHKSNRIGGRHL